MSSINWSPDGQKLVSSNGTQIERYLRTWDVTNFTLLSETDFSVPANVIWSPDSTQIYVATTLDGILRVDASSLLTTPIVDNVGPVGITTYDVALHPDGLTIAFASSGGFIYIWNILDNQQIRQVSGHTGGATGVAWSPDGTRIASVGLDDTLRIWDVSSGEELSATPIGNPVLAIDFSPNGDEIIYAAVGTGGIGSTIPHINVPQPSTCDSTIPASDTASLISAINTGNNGGSPYSICLANSVYTLNAVDNSNFIGANALPVITGDITIIGNGATLERAVSAPDFRFLRVANGATLTLENLTLHNGHTSGTSDAGDGGAIYNDGTLSLDSVILTNNIANIEAGAIYNNDAQILTITNSSFTGNRALGDDGGAIDNHGTATISSTTFADNHADSDDGGAIWNDDNAILTISDSIFTLNSAFDEGGIIMNFGIISLTNNIIANNSSGDDGGAISADTGSITITNGNFSNNISGDDGGAIMSYAPLNLSAVTLDGNNASDKGGAIYVWDSDLIINNSTLSNNISVNNGGAIYIGNASVSSYLLNSCVFGNTAGNTSGVYAENDNFDAISTWWGAIDGPGGSGTGSGDEVNSDVNFANFVATTCADAINSPAQSLAVLASNTVADSSNFPVVSIPYSNNFADNSDFSGSVRWTRDEIGWLLDSDIRGQSSTLEMTIWVELSNNPQINLTYLERADLASNDVITLEIQAQGSSDWIVLTQNIGTNYDWQETTISLADYRGETIRLRWTADIPADAPPGENSLSYAIDALEISRQ